MLRSECFIPAIECFLCPSLVDSAQIGIPILLLAGCILRARYLPTRRVCVWGIVQVPCFHLPSWFSVSVGMFRLLHLLHLLCIFLAVLTCCCRYYCFFLLRFLLSACSFLGWRSSAAAGVIISPSFCSMMSGWWFL